nr:PREDICTED: ATP-binding cassette sub-family G member 1 isoform X3 [Megachile rotundata]
MTTPPHCSPSRSSLSCCQIDHSSHDDVHGVTIAAKEDYFFQEKHSFPKRPEVDLAFFDVRYAVKEWSLRHIRPKHKEILHGVSGEFKAGELVAIMGPSGAGKSTLLNVLAGYTVRGVQGQILVNGKVRVPYSERWKRTSCYIQQDALMRTRITVGEAMTLAAHLKLGYTISSAYKHTQVLELLELLGLSHCYDTLCGKLSGGQKKRLDIALELLSNPSVLFLDEPTTGLDSSSCSQCIALLKRLAKIERRTVICTIHQPSALLLEMFDAIYTVAAGYCIYRGPVKSLLPHMSSVGADCPPYHNPADFLLEVAIGDYGISVEKLAAAVNTISIDDKSITCTMKSQLDVPQEMRILSREHFNRWYRLAPYYFSMLLVEIPFQAACAATYLVVSYWLTGQPVETRRIISFMVVSIAASLTAQAWGFFIGATTPVKIAVFAGPIIAVLFSVFGFCIRYMDTPQMFRWMFHISYFRASFHSLLHTVYGFGRLDLKCDDFYCHYKKPTQFLKEMDIADTSVVNNLILILGIGVLMHLLTASALWCKLNRR